MRLGWVVASTAIVRKLELIKQASDLAPAFLNQMVLLDVLEEAFGYAEDPGEFDVAFLAETLDGMREAASGDSSVLRPRTVAGSVLRALRRGPVSSRRAKIGRAHV